MVQSRRFRVLVVAGVLWLGGAGAGAGLFDGRIVPLGPGPTAIASGDFDRDGHRDMVVLDNDADTVSVHLGRGDATFAPPRVIGAIVDGTVVVVEDVNADGNQDVLTGGDAVTVFLGHGDGTFAMPVVYPAPAQPDVQDLALADFDGDSRLDVLATVVRTQVRPFLLPGIGDGTFGTMVLPEQIGPAYGEFVASGDFDEDGHLDFVSGYRLMLGDGQNGFETGAPLPLTVAYPIDGVATDLNQDGHLDLAVLGFFTSDVSVLLGNGHGTFTLDAVRWRVVQAAERLEPVDLDRDGLTDLVASSTSQDAITLLRSRGNGRFETPVQIPLPFPGGPTSSGDFNGDGRTDVVVACRTALAKAGGPRNAAAIVLPGDGSGGLVAPTAPQLTPTGSNPGDIVVADFDGDGRPDYAVVHTDDDNVRIAEGNGDGSFTPAAVRTVSVGPVGLAAGQVDVDTDPGETPDIVAVNRDFDRISVLLGTGGGGLAADMPVSVGQSPLAAVLADFNGDGRPDAATANAWSSDVSVLLGVGNGAFSPPVSFPVQGTPVALIAADLDADGDRDLAVAVSVEGEVAILSGNGDGSFQPETRFPAGTDAKSIAAADLDEDGFVDLVVGSGAIAPFDPPAVVLWGASGGTFSAPMPIEATAIVGDVVIDDADGDGRQDILLGYRDAPFVSVLLGSGGREFRGAEYAVRGNEISLATADFDGNGRLDLLAASAAEDTVTTLLNRDPTQIRFVDDRTLRWPILLGSETYNLYRGGLEALIDVDLDGLPDGGYGSCANEVDPDTTDTVFVVDSIPDPGAGTFYLMARIRDGVEIDLGTTGAGLPRAVTTCPP